jgi:hypothetical protein
MVWAPQSGSREGPDGYSYAGLLARADRTAVLDRLAAARFSGWVGPQEGAWVVAVAAPPRRSRRPVDLDRFVVQVAAGSGALILAVVVTNDRLLRLTGWAGANELGRYVSDPSYGIDEPAEPLDPFDPFGAPAISEPEGVEYATALAAACGRRDLADDLAKILAEPLDPESEIESERLSSVLQLLDLPRWLVAAYALPRRVWSGPPPARFTRLVRGHSVRRLTFPAARGSG